MEEQEISLYDYVKVIIKHKWIVIVIFLICVSISAILSLTKPDTYEVSALVQIGTIYDSRGERMPIVNKAEIKEILFSGTFLEQVVKTPGISATFEQLRGGKIITLEDIKDTDYLKLKIRYKDDTALLLCRTILDSYLAFSKKIYEEKSGLIQERLDEINNQIEIVESSRQKLDEVILQDERKGETETKIFVAKSILSNYQEQIQSLFNERINIKVSLLKNKEFGVIDSPLMSRISGRRKAKLNIVISAVFGLIFAIFIAFVVESWQKSSSSL